MGVEVIIAFIIKHRRLILEIAACLILAIILWWAFIHNPRKIKQLEITIAEQNREIKAREAAINLITNIERAHDEIDRQSNRNITIIRTDPRPSRTGYFILGGVLPTVHQTYTAARIAPFTNASTVPTER